MKADWYTARFEPKFVPEPNTGCWLWTAQVDAAGYGRFSRRAPGASQLAHRAAYEYHVGPVADGMQLDHLCRTRCCVNPAHLEAVTHAENLRRSPLVNKQRTHCRHGHEFTPENTRTRTDGGRECKACQKRRQSDPEYLAWLAAYAQTPERKAKQLKRAMEHYRRRRQGMESDR